jgi:tetratricopeptide (TPR) repeat protein
MPGTMIRSFGLTLALLAVSADAASQTRPGGAVGYDAAQRRVVDTQLQRTTGQRNALATRLGISQRLMRAIAQEVGLTNPRFSDAQLMAAVEAMAGRALEIQRENRRLREEVARLRDPTLRDPALGLLTRAEAALEEGRLADAEALYREIRNLRWDESRAAEEASSAALEAEVRAAELRQDFVRAQDIRLEASDRLLARSQADHERAFYQADAAAEARLREGEILGRLDALNASIALWRDRVLPMVPRERYPLLHSWAQHNLGNALRILGERMTGQQGTDALIEAETLLRDVVRIYSPRSAPERWATAQSNLATVLMTRSKRSAYSDSQRLEMVDQAITAYRDALTVRTQQAWPDDWADTQSNLANALMARSIFSEDAEADLLLAEAELAYQTVMQVHTRVANPVGWARAQHNLGLALSFRALRRRGPEGLRLFADALTAFNFAQEVRTRDARPFDWAVTQSSIGNVYETMGRMTLGQQRTDYFRRSEEAYRTALQVFDDSGSTVYQEQTRNGLARVRQLLATP